MGGSDSTVAVIGLGSIGGVIAGSLLHAGRHEVVACVRHPLECLIVERREGTIEVPIRALTDPADAVTHLWAEGSDADAAQALLDEWAAVAERAGG